MPLQQDVVGSKAKLKSSAIQGPPLPFSSLTGATLGGIVAGVCKARCFY